MTTTTIGEYYMMNKYCSTCEMNHTYTQKKVKQSFNVKGEQIEAEVVLLICDSCKQEMYDRDIEISNDIAIFDQYKIKLNLLTSYQIKAIREKYGLSQSAFATLLGFGEKTITRYETGSIQDQTHDLLMSMMSNELFFKYAWDRNREQLNDKENAKIALKLYGHHVGEFEYSNYETDHTIDYDYEIQKGN
jgi:putative zinc finger/helix-turn-helix YgiT family protein